MTTVPSYIFYQGGSIKREAYKEESGTERSFNAPGARLKKGNCNRCNAEGWYRIGYYDLLFNDNKTLHECEWENPIEQVDLKEIPPELLKQYEAGANEPNKMSEKQQRFYQKKRDGCLYKKKTGRYGSGLNNYKGYWKKKLKEERDGNTLAKEKSEGSRVA